jgi:hypothetical protein
MMSELMAIQKSITENQWAPNSSLSGVLELRTYSNNDPIREQSFEWDTHDELGNGRMRAKLSKYEDRVAADVRRKRAKWQEYED